MGLVSCRLFRKKDGGISDCVAAYLWLKHGEPFPGHKDELGEARLSVAKLSSNFKIKAFL